MPAWKTPNWTWWTLLQALLFLSAPSVASTQEGIIENQAQEAAQQINERIRPPAPQQIFFFRGQQGRFVRLTLTNRARFAIGISAITGDPKSEQHWISQQKRLEQLLGTRLRQQLTRYTDAYQLTPAEKQKLSTAAELETRRLCRRYRILAAKSDGLPINQFLRDRRISNELRQLNSLLQSSLKAQDSLFIEVLNTVLKERLSTTDAAAFATTDQIDRFLMAAQRAVVLGSDDTKHLKELMVSVAAGHPIRTVKVYANLCLELDNHRLKTFLSHADCEALLRLCRYLRESPDSL